MEKFTEIDQVAQNKKWMSPSAFDHQTPPHVTLDQYRLFRRLLDEYTAVG